MPTQTLPYAPLSLAAFLAGELEALYRRREPGLRAQILDRLDELSRVVEAAPELDPDEMGYFRNRLTSSRELAGREEFGAAEYEMRQLRRKLLRRLDATAAVFEPCEPLAVDLCPAGETETTVHILTARS